MVTASPDSPEPSAIKVLALPSGAEPGPQAVGTPTHTLWPFASYPIPLPPQTHTLRKLTTIPGTLHQLPSVEVLTASLILIPYELNKETGANK